MMYRIVAAFIVSVAMALLPLTVGAAEKSNRGLFISPSRQEMTASPSKVSEGKFTVANYTDKTLTVNLSVKQFQTADFTYEYEFSAAHDDWIKLGLTQVVLTPQQSKVITYAANVPATASPGGHYFAFFASSDMSSKDAAGFKQTAEVVSLLFMKVSGKLVRTGSIENGTVPFLITDGDVQYKFDASNTGNVHYSAFFFGYLEGLFGKQSEYGTGHVLMPGTKRTIEGSVPSPMLPGIYKLTYGYKTDFDTTATAKTAYVLYAPLWSIAAVVILVFGGIKGWQFYRSKTKKAE